MQDTRPQLAQAGLESLSQEHCPSQMRCTKYGELSRLPISGLFGSSDFFPKRPGFQILPQVVTKKGPEDYQALVPLLRREAQAAEFVSGQVLGKAE